ncbi:MAG: autotransporter-associated beta strand repeat-containing protein [Verrucomicrobia bacterium]|nr:autotransporter-associated beta strand repeat-containing protein [Verrucomicrobiota bacterium]
MPILVHTHLALFRSKLILTTTVALLLVSALVSSAATRTWIGPGVNRNWTTATNWSGSIAPVSGDTLVFNSTGRTTNNFAANSRFQITFTGGNNELYGNTVRLMGVACNSVHATNAQNQIGFPISLDANALITTTNGLLFVQTGIDLNGFTLTVSNALGGSFHTGANVTAGQISGNGAILYYGPGIFRVGGNVGNTFSGLFTASRGTLQLNKVGAGNLAISGNLQAGDAAAGTNTTTVLYFQSNQVGTNQTVTVLENSSINLNGGSQTFGPLVLKGGRVHGGSSVLNGTVTINASADTSRMEGSVRVAPGLEHRTFFVNDGTADPDLLASASLTGQGGLVKGGPGTMELTSSNTFSGDVMLTNGIVKMSHAGAMGLGDYVIVQDAGTLLLNNVSVSGRSLHLAGQGFSGYGALDAEGSCSWVAPISLELQSNIGTRTNSVLTLHDLEGFAGFNKIGPGKVTLSGASTPNSYSGTTHVLDGTLSLGKSVNVAAIPGNVVVGQAGGGASAILEFLQNEQIPNFRSITVNQSGTLFLKRKTETIASLSCSGIVRFDDFGQGGGQLNVETASFTNGQLSYFLSGTTPGTDYGQLNCTSLTLNNTVFNLDHGAFVPALGNQFTLVNKSGAGAISGILKDLPDNSIFGYGGKVYSLTYAGGDGNDLVLSRVTIPAPSFDASGIERLLSGNVSLRATGIPGYNGYRLQLSTNLVAWSEIGAYEKTNTNGDLEFVHYGVEKNSPYLFYRIVAE